MMMAKVMLFLPVMAAGVGAVSSFREGLASVAQELVVLMIFLATWSLIRILLGKNKKPEEPVIGNVGKLAKVDKSKQTPDEIADAISNLCVDQFTRGLRLYRELMKTDGDKAITKEAFYMSLIESSVRVAKPDVAEQVLQRMKHNGLVPSVSFLRSVMKLFAARRMHRECVAVWKMFTDIIEPDQVISSCVACAACEVNQTDLARQILADARQLFGKSMASREYLALMRFHARNKDWAMAIKDCRELMSVEMPIDNIVFNTVLSACTVSDGTPPAAVAPMRELFQDVVEHEKRFPPPIDSDGGKSIDVVSYNTMLKAYARGGDVKACFQAFEDFVNAGMEPDDITFSTLLDVCIDEDEHVLASVALERMSDANVPMNCVAMTTLMKGFVRSRRRDKAMELYNSMKTMTSPVKPDMVTYSMLIKAHCDAQDMHTALSILEDMLESECKVDDVVFTHLIEGCCQVNNLRLAEKLFADMRAADIKPSAYTCNALVKVYGKCGQTAKALETVHEMEAEYGIVPSVVVYTCLVSGLIRAKKYQEAWTQFERMCETLVPDAQSCQTMLCGLADAQMWEPLMSLAQKYVDLTKNENPRKREQLTKRPPGVPECLNYSLSALLSKAQVETARELYKLMVSSRTEVTVPQYLRRLGLHTHTQVSS